MAARGQRPSTMEEIGGEDRALEEEDKGEEEEVSPEEGDFSYSKPPSYKADSDAE